MLFLCISLYKELAAIIIENFEAISELQELAEIFLENFYAYFLELRNAAIL